MCPTTVSGVFFCFKKDQNKQTSVWFKVSHLNVKSRLEKFFPVDG